MPNWNYYGEMYTEEERQEMFDASENDKANKADDLNDEQKMAYYEQEKERRRANESN